MSEHREPAPVGASTLGERLETALADQRAAFDTLVEEGALQLSCAAHQELLDIQEAKPTEALERAIGHLSESIAALRGLAAVQLAVHEQLVTDANLAVQATTRLTDADMEELRVALDRAVASPVSRQDLDRADGL